MRSRVILIWAILLLLIAGGFIYWKSQSPASTYQRAVLTQPGTLKADFWGRRRAVVTRVGTEIHVALTDRDQTVDLSKDTAFEGTAAWTLTNHFEEGPSWFVFFDESGSLSFGVPGRSGTIVSHQAGHPTDTVSFLDAGQFQAIAHRALER